jgi:O-acetylhomoserine (thiol)-lyase
MKRKLETLCLHAGQETPDPTTMSRAVPIYRTSSYVFKNTRHAAALFSLKETGNIYTRLMNPTHDVLERRMAALEAGIGALALASGTAAVYYCIINICQAGDEFVSANNLYGGTFTQFNDILPQFNIRARFVDSRTPVNFARAITPKTKLLYVETMGNPALDVADIPAIAAIAHRHGLPLIVDSTFSTPYLQRPLKQGADIVVHSLTKWLGGHGAAIGGIVVDGGRFDWNSKKFPLYTRPDASYHGIRFARALGPQAFIQRMRVIPLRNLGACITPDNAWFFLQGLETLHVRMARHCENAMAVARFLQHHQGVAWVRYPGLEDDPAHPVATRVLQNGFGAMVVFGIQGGTAAGGRFIDALRLFSHLANVGDAKSLAIHPASTTHSQLTVRQQRAGGILPELVRLSIGIEHIDDVLEDIDQALKKAKG